MIETVGDIWTWAAEVVIIPTNGMVHADGSLVMGAGVAKEAAIRFPEIPKEWGYLVEHHGNNCYLAQNRRLISFPTKYNWRDYSVRSLIERSAHQVVRIADSQNIKSLAMPRVGCGLGGLKWVNLKHLLGGILDDRFVVLTPE